MLISVMSECLAQKYILIDTYNVDSLLQVIPGQLNEERVNSLNKLVISLAFVDDDRWIQYADEAMNLAKELNYEEGMARAFRNWGHIHQYHGNYPQALINYFQALSLYEKLDNKNTIAWVFYDISKTHYFANNYEKAIEYGTIALNKFRERTEEGATVGNVRDTMSLYAGFAETYALKRMPARAIGFYLEVLDVMKQNDFAMAELVINTFTLGSCYFNLGEIDSAKKYFRKTIAYPDENLNIQALKYRAYMRLGNLHYSLGEVDTAIFYLQKALEFYNTKGFLFWAISASNTLGFIYYKNDDLNSAEKYLQISEGIFNEMMKRNSWHRHDSLKYIAAYGFELYFPVPVVRIKEFMWGSGRTMYSLLYQLSDAKNRIDKAYQYYIAYSNAKDTLYKLKRNRETVELQTRYESERKDQQIETLSLENELAESRLDQNRYFLIGSAGLFIIILMFVYTLFRQNRLKTNQRVIVLQQKLLRTQMNPHFIFNSLTSIQGFIVEKEPRTANKYLSRFAMLVRNILDSSAEEFAPLDKEISTIVNYLELQKMRYEEKFDYTVVVDETLETDTITIPPMLAQPFIENSIEHGFRHKDGKGNIIIRFDLFENRMRFEVVDDGIGREKAREILHKQDKDHRSMATDITRERIANLNKKRKKKITLEIFDLKDETGVGIGTKVVFEIPIAGQ
jgi:tetratricopeptide (TPR) repeat protein